MDVDERVGMGVALVEVLVAPNIVLAKVSCSGIPLFFAAGLAFSSIVGLPYPIKLGLIHSKLPHILPLHLVHLLPTQY